MARRAGAAAARRRPAGDDAAAAGAVTLPFYAGCAIPQDHELHALVAEVAAGFGVRLDEAADAGCCGHPSRGAVGTQFAAGDTVYTACPACDASLERGRRLDRPALGRPRPSRRGAPAAACGPRRPRSSPTSAASPTATRPWPPSATPPSRPAAPWSSRYPTLHNGCCGALGGMYRGATKASGMLLEFAAGKHAPVVTSCVLCRDNLRSAARELRLDVPVHFWPEFFRAVPDRPGGHDRCLTTRPLKDDAVATARPARPSRPTTRPTSTTRTRIIAETSFKGRSEARQDLIDRIMNDPRMHDHKDGFQSCIQCGICTSGCPAARFTDYTPREVARRALEGDPTLLEDDNVWYCFYCYTCQSRCPRKNSVAVINQVVRSMQVESGYGVKHVEMFAAWGEQFYDKGMGGTPHVFFSAIAEAWGPKWKDFIANRDAMREEMGLGGMYPPRPW